MMKAGTLVMLPDGRFGRVVYHGLDGFGIRFGSDPVDVEAIMRGGLFSSTKDESLLPQAMLRDAYPGASIECIGEDFEVVEEKVTTP